MTEFEKVVAGLKVHLKELSVGKSCGECPYVGVEPCEQMLIADAIALLKAQMPRVMTLEEVRRDHDRVVWIECDDSKTQNVGQYRGQTGWHANCATEWERFVTIGFATDYLHRRVDKYGKEWRCWTSRPSPEQMANTPWEVGE